MIPQMELYPFAKLLFCKQRNNKKISIIIVDFCLVLLFCFSLFCGPRVDIYLVVFKITQIDARILILMLLTSLKKIRDIFTELKYQLCDSFSVMRLKNKTEINSNSGLLSFEGDDLHDPLSTSPVSVCIFIELKLVFSHCNE